MIVYDYEWSAVEKKKKKKIFIIQLVKKNLILNLMIKNKKFILFAFFYEKKAHSSLFNSKYIQNCELKKHSMMLFF